MIRFLMLFLPFLAIAQTGDEIIAQNLEKTGGYKNWMSLHSVELEGQITFGIKEVYPIIIYQKRPNWTLSVIEIKGKNFILEGYNGKKAIQNDFNSGKVIAIANYHPENFDTDLLNYKDKGFKAEYLGKVNVQDKSCFKVALRKNTVFTYYYFDVQSYQLLREDKDGETLLYSDFKNVEGRIFPFRIESINDTGNTQFLLQIKRLQPNKLIPDKYFNF